MTFSHYSYIALFQKLFLIIFYSNDFIKNIKVKLQSEYNMLTENNNEYESEKLEYASMYQSIEHILITRLQKILLKNQPQLRSNYDQSLRILLLNYNYLPHRLLLG